MINKLKEEPKPTKLNEQSITIGPKTHDDEGARRPIKK